MIDIDLKIDFEEEPVVETKVLTWHNVNDIMIADIERYKKGYNPLNPFKVEDKVILNKASHPRYNLIEGLSDNMVGSVSDILGNNMINIAYWDTQPSVIKNVSVHSVTLSKTSTLLNKLRNLFIRLVRSVINPNKLPKRIQKELDLTWKE